MSARARLIGPGFDDLAEMDLALGEAVAFLYQTWCNLEAWRPPA